MNSNPPITGNKTEPLDEATPRALKRAASVARRTARRAAGNFHYAFALLPEDQRRGIEALYAFCRVGDDIADATGGGIAGDKTGQLDDLRRRLDLCYRREYYDDLTLALAWAIRRFGLERRHFDELLLGLETDLSVKSYRTFGELRQYCYRVASTVGLLCIQIFGGDTPGARRYAEDLGIGMQLTNILRDLNEDFRRGRCYIPLEDLTRFGLTPEGLFERENKGKLKELAVYEVNRAWDFFDKADRELPPSLSGTLFAARIMGAIYRRILERIAEADRFDRRISLSSAEKITIAARLAPKI